MTILDAIKFRARKTVAIIHFVVGGGGEGTLIRVMKNELPHQYYFIYFLGGHSTTWAPPQQQQIRIESTAENHLSKLLYLSA